MQWMTAGGGVIHSEMPTPEFHREGGVQQGFQIWVNLPAADKMMTPRYQTLRAAKIPVARQRTVASHVRVIAGESLGCLGAHRHARADPDAALHDRAGRSRRAGSAGGTEWSDVRLRGCGAHRRRNREVTRRSGGTARSGRLGVASAVDAECNANLAQFLLLSGQAAQGAGGPLRPVRDEHARADRTGVQRLSERPFGVIPERC